MITAMSPQQNGWLIPSETTLIITTESDIHFRFQRRTFHFHQCLAKEPEMEAEGHISGDTSMNLEIRNMNLTIAKSMKDENIP